jgi:hypothetical protein
MTDPKENSEGFEQKIVPVLERYESQRKKCLKNWGISVLVIALVCFGGAFLISQKSSEAPAKVMFVGVLITGVLGFIALSVTTKGYKRGFKDEVIRAVVHAYQADLHYQPANYISEHTFRASELFLQGIDRYSGEDYVSGKRDKTDFEFSEIHAEYKTTTRDSKGRTKTRWHTIFKGVFFIADFHKDFRTHTVVLPDTAEKLFGFLGKKLQSMNIMRDELIKLEDPEFEKAFCVYGGDQVEARYILSPGLMRRILECKAKFSSKIYLAFLDSKVYVAISSNKNRFEPRVFQSVNDMSLIHEYKEDLDLIVDIVDDLNLNTRLWSKE